MKSSYGFQFIPPLGNPSAVPGRASDDKLYGCHGFPDRPAPAGVNGPAPNYLESPTTDINPADNVVWQKGQSHNKVRSGVRAEPQNPELAHEL